MKYFIGILICIMLVLFLIGMIILGICGIIEAMALLRQKIEIRRLLKGKRSVNGDL